MTSKPLNPNLQQKNPPSPHEETDQQTFQVTVPYKDIEPQPDFFEKVMTKQRIMSSKILGEEVLEAREEAGIGELEGDYVVVIKGSQNPDHGELIKKSAIGVASSPYPQNPY